jgi:uncharacterized membrane protein
MTKKKMDYDDYVKEREQLSRYEHANYDSYEKTLLTLSAAFLAFSVSFLALLKRKTESGMDSLVLASPELLVCSWVSFASSVFLMVLCFLISTLALRKETAKLEKALEDVQALEEKNLWTSLVYLSYILSGIGFISGIVFLLIFCAKNIQRF